MELRNTGRTTRMLIEANRLIEANHPVIVVATNESAGHISHLRHKLGLSTRLEITPIERIQPFNWQTMRRVNDRSSTVYLIDHFTIEYKHRQALVELHRFDLPVNNADARVTSLSNPETPDRCALLQAQNEHLIRSLSNFKAFKPLRIEFEVGDQILAQKYVELEAQIAEASKDSNRLEFMIKTKGHFYVQVTHNIEIHYYSYGGENGYNFPGNTPREAIDAAMAAAGKDGGR